MKSHFLPRFTATAAFAAGLTLIMSLIAAPAASAQAAIKVLFWGGPGGGAHNVPAFRDTIVPYLTGLGMTVQYRQNTPYSWIHADSLAQYDVMLVYTTNQTATDLSTGQITTISNWLASGRVMVALHGTTNTFINNSATVTAAWRALLGAQYTGHGPRNDGGTVTLTATGNSHSSLTGTTMLPTSALNTGGAPYWDEGREHINFVSDTVVLARCQTTVNLPWIWVRPQGNGWVYYNASGHDGQVWTRSEFKGQIVRALQWGYGIKTTGIRGQEALETFTRMDGRHFALPEGLNGTAHSLEVIDMQGRTVFRLPRSFSGTHDLSFLPEGVYGVNVVPERAAPLRGLFIRD